MASKTKQKMVSKEDEKKIDATIAELKKFSKFENLKVSMQLDGIPYHLSKVIDVEGGRKGSRNSKASATIKYGTLGFAESYKIEKVDVARIELIHETSSDDSGEDEDDASEEAAAENPAEEDAENPAEEDAENPVEEDKAPPAKGELKQSPGSKKKRARAEGPSSSAEKPKKPKVTINANLLQKMVKHVLDSFELPQILAVLSPEAKKKIPTLLKIDGWIRENPLPSGKTMDMATISELFETFYGVIKTIMTTTTKDVTIKSMHMPLSIGLYGREQQSEFNEFVKTADYEKFVAKNAALPEEKRVNLVEVAVIAEVLYEKYDILSVFVNSTKMNLLQIVHATHVLHSKHLLKDKTMRAYAAKFMMHVADEEVSF